MNNANLTENAIQKFRDNTNNPGITPEWRTQLCPFCKKTRSLAQFSNHKRCKTCRGVK